MNIENKVVVVTGAASGIGRALAQAFKNARAGKVYICLLYTSPSPRDPT